MLSKGGIPMSTDVITMEDALHLDKEDALQKYREEFYLLDERIYLDGNSLGLLSKRAERSLLTMLDSWKKLGIDGWTEAKEPWFFLSEHLVVRMAPLVGADKEEVIASPSSMMILNQILSTNYKQS